MRLPPSSCFVPVGALLFGFLTWLVLPIPMTASLAEEGGYIETATVAAYWLALLALGIHGAAPGARLSWTAVLVVVTALTAREMDQHVAWTHHSVLKLSFYLGAAPMAQKFAALLAVAVFFAAVAYLAVKHGRATLASLRGGDSFALTVALFMATLVVSKMLDRAVSLLVRDVGVSVPVTVRVLVLAMEEMIELSLPLLLVFGSLQQRAARKPRLGVMPATTGAR